MGQGKSLGIEFRIPGADSNPYLVFAASIACWLGSIEQKIEPPALSKDNVYDHINDLPPPKHLEEPLIIVNLIRNSMVKMF